jgi:hypothetical protein
MAKPSFWDHPIDKLEEALNLKKQIHSLQQKLSSMFDFESDEAPKRGPGRPARAAVSASPVAKSAVPAKRGGKRTMSPEARERIAAAQRARWAKARGGARSSKAAAFTPKATAYSAKPAKAGRKGKRTVSPEVRARLAAAMKARWAAAKKSGRAINARR